MDDDKCFQYSVTVALDHQKIGKDPEGISKNRTFIKNYE